MYLYIYVLCMVSTHTMTRNGLRMGAHMSDMSLTRGNMQPNMACGGKGEAGPLCSGASRSIATLGRDS